MAKKNFLDSIKVPVPCDKNWEDMSGGDQKRFCSGCEKNVYNISAMRHKEARRLVAKNAGKICIRYTRLPNGQVQTTDRKLYSISRRTSAVAAGVIAVTLTISALTAAQTVSQTPDSVSVIQKTLESDSKAKISITVTDQNGAIISKARIILTDKNGNIVEGVSNEQGFCEFTKISPSIYEIKILIDGFKPLVKSDLNFTGEKTLEIKLSLEAITVDGSILSGEQETLGVTSTEFANPITPAQIESLPPSKNSFVLGLFAAGVNKDEIAKTLLFTVLDQHGAVIPDTRITLTNQKTKETFNVVTSDEGIARLDLIRYGKYFVTAVSSIKGFSEYRQTIEISKKTKSNTEITLKINPEFIVGELITGEIAASSKKERSSELKSGKNKRQNRIASGTSRILFTVYDSNGDVIPGAQIELTNEKTKAEFNAVTTQNGAAQFNSIPHGRYSVLVSFRGFNDNRQYIQIKEAVEPNIKVILNVGVFTGIVVANSDIPLFQAIVQEDNEAVKNIINAGFNIETRDSSGKTALHVAIEHENIEIVSFLLEKGAKINVKDGNKFTPLLMLEDNLGKDNKNTVEILRLLIAKGANVNFANEYKETLLMLACEDENLEIVRILLMAKADPNLKDEDGETAIQKTNSEEIKNLLRSYGAR